VTSLGDEYTPSEARINRIFDRLDQRIRSIIMGKADETVQGVTEQLNKASAEIAAEVQKLQDAGVSDESLSGLRDVAQRLDDRTADTPPVEESPGDTGTNPDGVTDSSE
jgi:hypothetical protein